MRCLPAALSACLCLSAALAQEKPPPDKKKLLSEPVPGYKKLSIEGFDVLVHKDVLDHNDDARYERKPLDVLELELRTVGRSMQAKSVAVLRRLVIWVEWDDQEDPDYGSGTIAKYYGVFGNQALWSLKKGKHPLKANNVEIIRMKSLTAQHQPGVPLERCVLLHELAHAVHFHIVGTDNPRVKATYLQAMERGLYDEAKDLAGRTIKPYARTNEREYFAELSCAYLNKLHYFPNTRDELKKHDPNGYKLMEAVWGTPRELDAARKAADEKAAAAKLAAAKKLHTGGKTDEAVAALEALLDEYDKTRAGAEAKALLEKLKK